MKKPKNPKPLARALGIVSAVVIVVSGVTFAALLSQQAVLTGNSIETASANLQVSTDGTNYATTHAGFDFNGLIPGGPAMPTAGNPFYLRNIGSSPLALKFSVTTTPNNPNNVDLNLVAVNLITVGNGAQVFSLQQLIDANSTGGVALTGGGSSLAGGAIQQYKLQVSMNANAVNGSASLSNIDFAFSGT
jgi:hypothetical protein